MPAQSPREVGTGPRNQRKRPGDLTGVQGQQLAAERDARQAEAVEAAEAAKVADRAEKVSSVVDYTQPAAVVQEVDVPAEPLPETMKIRVNYPIEDMTFGREVIAPPKFDEEGRMTDAPILGGLNTYNFEEGREYIVSRDLGEHLTRLGYVYGF